MTPVRSPTSNSFSVDQQFSAKRKLDDYDDSPHFSGLLSVRMRKEEPDAVDTSSDGSRHSLEPWSAFAPRSPSSAQCSDLSESSWGRTRSGSTRIQFFVRMISEGRNVVFNADQNDTVLCLHERIQVMTGIPVFEQRLIYEGKQLQWEQSLADCSIKNDAGLHLVGRMRSVVHPQAWQLIDDMVSAIRRMCRREPVQYDSREIKCLVSEFLSLIPKDNNESASCCLQIFMAASAPAALVMLYLSSIKGHKESADISVRHFLNSCRNTLSSSLHNCCCPIVLEFCKLLKRVSEEDPLYLCCRSTLGSLLETKESFSGLTQEKEVKGLFLIQEIFPFISELANKLSKDLMSSTELIGPLLSDVRDFTAFLGPLRAAILRHVGHISPITFPLWKADSDCPGVLEVIECLHRIFTDLLEKMEGCLIKMEPWLALKSGVNTDIFFSGWSQYLAVLKELNEMSKLYQGAEKQFLSILRRRKPSLCALIIRYAKRTDDHQWILEHKDVTDFAARRHLVMMMFPEVKEDYEELHEMLIDRCHLLSESFEYIAHADPESLHGGLFMEFKNEEATGPGVLREWFFLVCQDLFNPQNALFEACPFDRRRFYPNPASKVDPMHLEYFSFSGRVIALALMHKVQVGVLFDRSFFLQLAGRDISLEDIRDADPVMHRSCKQILELDHELIDSDALGLTFVREIEELGSRKVVELCSGGEGISVNSTNREEYVRLLIRHRYVKSVSEQVSCFAQGFADILSSSRLQRLFFQSLELEDLDWMLYGSERLISVEDWKAHTDYNGYKETDPQIVWFWNIVAAMSEEQRKVLLFFWTSVKYLPVEGFRGLASRLYIYRTSEPTNHLPLSHTCFYRLCFPAYPSGSVMKDRLKIITQDHVGCSFGNW